MARTSNDIHHEEEARQPKTRGDERRQSLVEAAYQLLAEKGFEGLRVRDVAASAGVNIATLHYYFTTKEVLVQGVVDHLLNLFISVHAQPSSDTQWSMVEQVRQLFIDVQHQMQTMPEMFVVLTELHLHAQRNTTVKASLNGILQQWRSYVEGILRQGVEQALFNPDLNIPRTATILMALIEGLSLRSITEDDLEFERIGGDMVDWLTKARNT